MSVSRVLHLAHGRIFGGIESVLVSLAGSVETLSHDAVQFALCFDGALAAQLRERGVPLHMLGATRVSRPWSVMTARVRLGRVLRTERPDVVVTHGAWSHAMFGRTVLAAGIRLVHWQHDPFGGRHWTERLAGWSSPDAVICNSHYTAATLRNVFPAAPYRVVYCPVRDPTDDAPISGPAIIATRSEMDTSDASVVIIHVGRMQAGKGQQTLLRALAQVDRTNDWVCWLVGGSQRPDETAYELELRRLASSLGIVDRIRFCGHRRDVARLLAAADVHCHPSNAPEAFGIVFVEALYHSLPIVATAHGGAVELLDSSCAVLVPPCNVAALADALSRLVRDETERDRLGAGGPQRARCLCRPADRTAEAYAYLTTVVQNARRAEEVSC